MAYSRTIGLPLLLFISRGLCSEEMTVEPGRNVLISPSDVICVLANTTAWFNWTHTLVGETVMEWTSTNSDYGTSKLMSYANGQLLEYQKCSRRCVYIDSPGSAMMYLKNVSERDDGTYEVSISRLGAPRPTATSTVKLRVIPPSKIGVRVTIEGIRADITVAENGTDVTLPNDRVMFTLNPSVTIENLYPVPWLSSSYHISTDTEGTKTTSNDGVIKRSHDRRGSYDIMIEVKLGIQNLDKIRIKKPMHPPTLLKNTPGHIKVLAGKTAVFNWTHDIKDAAVEWSYEGTRETPEFTSMMAFNENQLHIFMNGDRAPRLGYEYFPGSAVLELKNVHKRDEGFYNVKIVDLDSASNFHLNDVTEMSVIEEPDLQCNVEIGSAAYDISLSETGTDVILADVDVFSQSGLNIYINIPDTAPTPDVIRVYTEQRGRKHTHVERLQTRLCAGHIPERALTGHNEARITIEIDFGVQNLGLVSIHTQAVVQPGTGVNHNGASTLALRVQIWALVYIVLDNNIIPVRFW